MSDLIKQLRENVRLKFSSGNGVPVDRAVITREEYEAITQSHEASNQVCGDCNGTGSYPGRNGDIICEYCDVAIEADRKRRPAQHLDDAAVDAFADAMKAKLADARAKGRGGWQNKDECTQQQLSDMLRDHVAKGDPCDVANFAMFLHQRGESIAPAQPVAGEAETFLTHVTANQAQMLLESFGGGSDVLELHRMPAGAVLDDDDDPMPEGLYIVSTNAFEEGYTYLGEEDKDAVETIDDTAPPSAAVAVPDGWVLVPVEQTIDAAAFQAWVVANWDRRKTPVDGNPLRDLYIMGLGIGGEAGEVQELLKKHVRDGREIVADLELELGDVLHYLSRIASQFGLSLGGIMEANRTKIERRHQKRIALASEDAR